MRCLALGQAWQDVGGKAVFALRESLASVEERIRAERMGEVHLSAVDSLEDAGEVIRIAGDHHAGWVVLDGYGFNVSHQRALKDAGLKLLVIDDCAAVSNCFADLVLNQNAFAREEFYPATEPWTRLLLGPRFAMLRREFAGWKEWDRSIAPCGSKILVTMGGSDPDNVTLAVIEALCLVKNQLEVVVVIGGNNPHRPSLESAATNFHGNFRLLTNAGMPELMAWADLAVSSSGTTSAELCMLGLPAILIDIAANQSPVAKELDRLGAAIHFAPSDLRDRQQLARRVEHVLASSELRMRLSETARTLVDGEGAQRVVSAILESGLQLRPAEERDCTLLWEWANEPAVRAASFHQGLIPWERHVQWFQSRLRDPQAARIMMAVSSDHRDIGAVRFDLNGSRAVVSITLDKNARGMGHGRTILTMAAEELFRTSPVMTLDAYVKPQNEASRKLFESANFQKNDSLESIDGEQAIHFVLCKKAAS